MYGPGYDPLKKRKRSASFSYKVTCEKVKRFHLAAADHTFRFLVGGVGTGKTLACVAELVMQLLTNPEYIGTTALCVVLKQDHIRQNIFPMIRSILENRKNPLAGLREGMDYRISYSPLEVTFKTNGSKIIFASSESGAHNLASLNCSLGMLDEADKTNPDVFNEVFARLGRSKNPAATDYPPPMMICTLNPTAPSHWLCKRFFEGWLESSTYDETERNYIGGEMPPNVWMATLSQYDNPHAKAKWQANETAYDYSNSVKRRMLYGQFVSSEGTVFGESFDPDNHVYTPQMYRVPMVSYKCHGLDFGATASGYTACLWVAHDTELKKYVVYREYKGVGKSPAENYAAIMKASTSHEGPISKTMSDVYTETWLSYKQLGMHIVAAPKGPGSIEAGIGLIMQLFHQNQLWISKECKGLIGELESYAYNPNTGKPKDRDNNFIDALRYVLWEMHGNSVTGNYMIPEAQTITEISHQMDADRAAMLDQIKAEAASASNQNKFIIGYDRFTGAAQYARN